MAPQDSLCVVRIIFCKLKHQFRVTGPLFGVIIHKKTVDLIKIPNIHDLIVRINQQFAAAQLHKLAVKADIRLPITHNVNRFIHPAVSTSAS